MDKIPCPQSSASTYTFFPPIKSIFVQRPYRRQAPIGGTPLYQKQLGVFLKFFNILRKKGEINFKIGGIG
jgi:hypothetical protein